MRFFFLTCIMTPIIHNIYIWIMIIVTCVTTIYLANTGYSYYSLPLEERFYHPSYDWFKPAGVLGHGLGILGTAMILFGVVIYIARKRYNFLSKYIRLKYLLEFHIFLCFLGSILVLFHTSFKFGGIVSIAFWSMVVVVLSGIVGRYIYIQIPRSIEGRELSLMEVHNLRESLNNEVENYGLQLEPIQSLIEKARNLNSLSPLHLINTSFILLKIKGKLRAINMDNNQVSMAISTIKTEISLSQKIDRLQSMQKIFKYWHVAHMPFALIMLVIVIIHIAVTLALGYKWIF